MSDPKDNRRGHLEVVERTQAKRPDLYNVLLFNDDYTPRDFVVGVLTQFFPVDDTQANNIMLTAHIKGQAVCDTFPREIAETKVQVVTEYIRGYELPLRFDMDRA